MEQTERNLTLAFGHSVPRNLITRVLTICHVKLTQSTAMEQKRKKRLIAGYWSLSPALDPGYQRWFSREFSVLAEGRSHERRSLRAGHTIKTWQKPETAPEKSLAPRVPALRNLWLLLVGKYVTVYSDSIQIIHLCSQFTFFSRPLTWMVMEEWTRQNFAIFFRVLILSSRTWTWTVCLIKWT